MEKLPDDIKFIEMHEALCLHVDKTNELIDKVNELEKDILDRVYKGGM